ncbi:MAG TPA: hypothetical protein DCQ64_16345 [Candidatus Rokubacteria bacterium]|nr:hypothetical protein [Candidatus Rokubacteria bacterium]
MEYRKKQVRARTFEVVPVEDAKSPAARRKHQSEIDRVKCFLEKPNRVDGLGFSTWIGQAIEEALTVDALCFFKQWHFSGNLSYVQVDGETIKPVIDQWGHVIGYQQILYGMPATQYRAPVIDEYGKGELAYWVYNPRVTGVYGTSALEEILPIIMTAIKRSQTHLGWYTDGNIPDAFLSTPEGWTADQIIKYQKFLDEELTDPKQRRKARALPHGSTYVQAKPFAFSKEEEDAIAAIVLAYMGVPKMVLVSQVNRATAESQQEDAGDVGLSPLVRWLEENLTTVIQEDLGAPELKVICTDGLAGQDASETDNDVKLVTARVITVDEARAKRGLEPLQKETDTAKIDPALIQRAFLEAGVITRDELRATIGLPPAPEGGDQYVTIGAFSATPGYDIENASGGAPKPSQFGVPKPAFGAPPHAPVIEEAASADRDAVVAHAVGLLTDDAPAAKAERAAWRRYAVNRFAKGRHADAFECKHLAGPEAGAIRKALSSARTREEVLAAFEKAKAPKLTEAKKEKAVATIKSAAMKLFEKQYGEAMARAKEMLHG